MPLPLNPRVVVTGAGNGLGRAFCLELKRRGARIIVSDVDLQAARETAALLGEIEAHAVRCDVSVLPDVRMLAATSNELLGGVDLLINNAGVAVGGELGGGSFDDWRWIIGVNLWGVIHGCEVFLAEFRKAGRGHILNVASAAGLLSLPQMGPYNVTKAGVVALSETLYSELGRGPIGVTVSCPMFFRTDIARRGRLADASVRELAEALMSDSRLTATDVARLSLAGVDAGQLYVVPHAKGRWLWRFKRLLPRLFHALAKRLIQHEAKRLGVATAPPLLGTNPH
ncbi:MAG: hypothetical protein RL490_2255 [Pseudomonadota bacterium]